MTLKELFKKQTGLDSPINMPVSTIYNTDTCNCFGCTEHCKSCWNGTVRDETIFKVSETFAEKMANFKIAVIGRDNEIYFEDCFGNKA